jgi:catechol 2,3-dioxygenase-like lactoylglutathione lyase family enzyme
MPKPALTATGLDHVVLYCRDPAASGAFYTDVLGMTVRFESDAYVFLGCGSQVVALFRGDGKSPSARRELDHVAFTVDSPFDDTLARLEDRGIDVITRAGDPRCIYFDDPDGHRIQILAAGG